MPIAIVLRTSGSTNIFRDALISAVGSGHFSEALLCSGFFQENFKGSAYQASMESSLGSACAKSGIKLTTVGVHNTTWMPSYKTFRANMMAYGANINCFYKHNMRWHAKVFVASSAGMPALGIVGSSNITRNAFSTGSQFNNECDVFMWQKNSPIAGFAEEVAGRLEGQVVVRAPYLRRYNNNISLSEQLREISEKVLEQDLRQLI